MVNFALTRSTGDKENNPDAALAALETYLETLVDTTTIIYVDIMQIGPGKYWQYVVLHD